ncbi:hypothetical protein BRN51_07760 [Xanthomonas oryzae pv. oryzae]|nr:hypothetical protein BRN51_07760 [Xanthomonas oryzae pv. oryzae]RBF79331.1 hypothetical protein BRM95_26375 [Xanthomonas oryzae pv. oryzae]RBK61178.1 hypothetical protein BRN49_17015 [Xanthomonas oryzae pv. oryzae]UEQ20992.1 hypothetical protein KFK26_07380 [Xanthomonas oryzae]
MQYCEKMIGGKFANASVTHSFEYGATSASRRSGVKQLKAAVAKIFRGCGG